MNAKTVADVLARWYVKARLVVIAVWVGGVVWLAVAQPPTHAATSGALRTLLPSDSPAVRAERISARRFGFPLLSQTIVVVHNPHGLPRARQLSLLRLSARLSQHELPAFHRVAGALPLSNSVGRPPLTRGRGTTMLLYLLFRSSVSAGAQTTAAQRLVKSQIGHRPGEYEGVTGEAPAAVATQSIISSRLGWVELGTILVVAFAVGVRFRAPLIAALVVGAVVAAYIVSDRLVALVARASSMTIPSEANMVLVVLVFGVTTDYSIFFISRFRTLLRDGHDQRDAAVRTVRQITPLVATAGLTVAAGTACLVLAKLGFIRGFGPALAIAVAVAMCVAVTLVPAALAAGGRWLYWPDRAQIADPADRRRRFRLAGARHAARHPLIAVLLAAVAVLAAASGLRHMRVGNQTISGLPASSSVRTAYEAGVRGFAPGALAPAVLVVAGTDIGRQTSALDRLQELLSRRRGVAGVLGPRQQTATPRTSQALWRTTNAARYALFLGSDPLGPRAIADIHRLQSQMPALLRTAGLGHARGMLGGDTAVSAEITRATIDSLAPVIAAMLAVIFVLIALLLRALVAPAVLIVTSVLAAGAALGLEAYVMQAVLGYGDTAYYVILTVAVLLISLGSDYNVFLAGRIWQEGRRRELTEAVAAGGSLAARPIATAAVVLAFTFLLLALVPLDPFREIAFAMASGLLIDAFIIRGILVPGLLVLVGPRAAWPGKRLRTPVAE